MAVANSASVTTRKVNQTNLPGTSSVWQIRANSINVGSGGTINGSELSSSLNDGSVSLTAVGTATGQGNTTVNDAVSSSGNVILSLSAAKDIQVNNNVSLTGTLGRLVLNYNTTNDYYLNNGSKITLSGAGATLRINSTDYTVVNSLGVAGDTTSTTLQGIKNNLTGNYALGSDIDASATSGWNGGAGFSPIGDASGIDYSSPDKPNLAGEAFQGRFHGLGHKVNDLYINRPDTDFVGLFGIISSPIVRNIGLANVSVTGRNAVGGLAGANGGIDATTIISKTSVSGEVNGLINIGGLVGANATYDGIANIYSSSSSATVNGWDNVGGITGSNSGYSFGSIGNVINSYNTGAVNGHSRVGGLVGLNSASDGDANIINSYSTGYVQAYSVAGGLIGSISNGSVNTSNSYWDTTTSGQSTSAGGTGKTTAELKQIATFTGWDITDVSNTSSNSTWVIDENNATPWLR